MSLTHRISREVGMMAGIFLFFLGLLALDIDKPVGLVICMLLWGAAGVAFSWNQPRIRRTRR